MQNFVDGLIVGVSCYFCVIFKENTQYQVFSVAVFTSVCDIICLWYHQSLECLHVIQICGIFRDL